MDESIAEENSRKRAYEVCRDPACPAHLNGAGLSHGHLILPAERELTPEMMEEFKAKWQGGKMTTVHTDGSESVVYPIESTPVLQEAPTMEWISIPLNELMQLVGNYTSWVETAETKDVCKCEWLIHPDDVDKKPEEGKRRMRRGDTSLECPAHTKEGYLLGFFEWLKTHGG